MDKTNENAVYQLPTVRALYCLMTAIENKLGGGEGVEGLYGSITGRDMQRILNSMRERCALGPASHLIDIGSGLGRPLVHASILERIPDVTGIELDAIKCTKANSFCEQTVRALRKRGMVPDSLAISPPTTICSPVEALSNLRGATHAYSFWEGVPGVARAAFGRLFAKSKDTVGVTVVQRSMRGSDPVTLMRTEYEFPNDLVLEESFSVKMSGSGQQFTAYVFSRRGRGKCQGPANVNQVPEWVPTPPMSPERVVTMLLDEGDGAEGLASSSGGRTVKRRRTALGPKAIQKSIRRSHKSKNEPPTDELLDNFNGLGKTAFPLTRGALRILSGA